MLILEIAAGIVVASFVVPFVWAGIIVSYFYWATRK